MGLLSKITSYFKKDEPKLSNHKYRIFTLLRTGWYTQIDVAKMGLSLNLSKRLCEMEYEIAPKYKIERRWKAGQRLKEYRIVRL